MSEISIRYNGRCLVLDPWDIYVVMFLLVRELERDCDTANNPQLLEVLSEYRLYYSIGGDIFADPTGFDDVFDVNPEFYAIFLVALKTARARLLADPDALRVDDLNASVGSGVQWVRIDMERLMDTFLKVESLLEDTERELDEASSRPS